MRLNIRAAIIACGIASSAFALPDGFVDEPIVGNLDRAVGVAFASPTTAFIWEKAGKVWRIENGVKAAFPIIDISSEVRNFADYGMLGFALDPAFASNGRVYLLYAVDYYDLVNMGQPGYNPAGSQGQRDSIGRITRYTLNAANGFQNVVPNSRTVLLGESPSTGFPIIHQSHGVGMLAFGLDGSLFAGSGDSASYLETDTGGPRNGSSNTALADGIITPKEDVGAFRAQLVDSLAGKIIRISPETGNGLAGNPFFDAAAPRAPRSRMWALGFRNPYRFSVKPDSATPENNAGVLFIGDVGYEQHEELTIVKQGGTNAGWPFFEGLSNTPGYSTVTPPLNLDAPNPLANGGTCGPFFNFRNMLVQDSLNPPYWANPCDPFQQIPASLPRFRHQRPVLDWGHGGATHVPIYNGNAPSQADVTAPGSPVPGYAIPGSCAIGGDWYPGVKFGAAYQNTYFAGDFTGSQIFNIEFDDNNAPVRVRQFTTPPQPPVFITYNRFDGALYYVGYSYNTPTSTLRRIRKIPCETDLNADGLVDDADFVLFVGAYNLLDCFDPAMPPSCPSDFNSDSLVDDADFVVFIAAYDELICP
ncbi:MAG: PQQ-dependent sugar dehydrogenase [Planctomycetes bacterium]|nr:PQQ-dependent sugar dehydrogenase [Planctomycetota bacterium]